MQSFSGKVAVVTGAASGIGAEIASHLSEAGAQVWAADIAPQERAQAGAVPGAIAAAELDVADEASWEAFVQELLRAHERIDILVNCAGVLIPGDIATTSFSDFERSMRINAGGSFLGCRAAVTRLMDGKRGGSIVNIASTTAIKPGSWVLAYAASKSAVTSITRSVALHCAQSGLAIRCNAVLPAVVRTPMVEALVASSPDAEGAEQALRDQHPTGRLVTAEEVAATVRFLASEAASGITGAAVPVDGALTVA